MDDNEEYRDELRKEIEKLKEDQRKFPTPYKAARIKNLKARLGHSV